MDTAAPWAWIELRNVLGGKRYEYLLALLTFIRAAHYWTVVHPGLEIEDDVVSLCALTRNSLHCSYKTPMLAGEGSV